MSGPPTLTTAIWILHGLHALQQFTIPLQHRQISHLSLSENGGYQIYQYPDIQWFKPLQPHVLPLKKDIICCKVCSQHLPGVEIWQISQNYPFPLLVAIMYLQEVGATLYVIDCVCYIPSIIPWLSLEISMKSPCTLFESTINTPASAPDLRSNCTKWSKNPVEIDVLAKQRSRRWVEFWDTKKVRWYDLSLPQKKHDEN